jgi:hypothetical protein
MKRLVGFGVLLAILVGALSSHSKTAHQSTTTAVGEPTAQAPASQATTPTRHHVNDLAYTRCDQNISAGPHTTCGFADNVFRAFAHDVSDEDGASADYTVDARSPATNRDYSMSCHTSGETTECSGGAGARVRFPVYAARVYTQPSSPQPEGTANSEGEEPEAAETAPDETEAEASREEAECTNGTYVNAAGNTVCSPEESPDGPPAGATAKCEDGTYSFSESRSGTCSHHGGVGEWLQ